jgi:hypothetical protein
MHKHYCRRNRKLITTRTLMHLLSPFWPSAKPPQHLVSCNSLDARSEPSPFSPVSHPIEVRPGSFLCGLGLLHLPHMQIFQPGDGLQRLRFCKGCICLAFQFSGLLHGLWHGLSCDLCRLCIPGQLPGGPLQSLDFVSRRGHVHGI